MKSHKVKCRKCGGKMTKGLAMVSTAVMGLPDFPGATIHSAGQTLSAGGPGMLDRLPEVP